MSIACHFMPYNYLHDEQSHGSWPKSKLSDTVRVWEQAKYLKNVSTAFTWIMWNSLFGKSPKSKWPLHWPSAPHSSDVPHNSWGPQWQQVHGLLSAPEKQSNDSSSFSKSQTLKMEKKVLMPPTAPLLILCRKKLSANWSAILSILSQLLSSQDWKTPKK